MIDLIKQKLINFKWRLSNTPYRLLRSIDTLKYKIGLKEYEYLGEEDL